MSTEEQDRLRRIKDQQLETRDPLKKQRKQDASIAVKHRKRTRSFSFTTMLDEIPACWIGLIVGLMVGGFFVLVLPLFLDYPWLDYATIGGTLFLMILGFLVGRAIDSQDTIKDLL
ncbi:MAG: hypothetical protein JXA25_00025 [Anaerolineales bacterium]|nr:hypothetical protein [Anaerolineales bacterium]